MDEAWNKCFQMPDGSSDEQTTITRFRTHDFVQTHRYMMIFFNFLIKFHYEDTSNMT